MANQQSDSPRYWVFKDAAENNLLQTDVDYSEAKAWVVQDTFGVKQSDIVYFWRREDSSYFYGWGVVEAAVPVPMIKTSSPRYLGVYVRYRLIFPTPITSSELMEDPALRSLAGIRQIHDNVIELNKTHVIALNRLIRKRDLVPPTDPLPDEDPEDGEEQSNVTTLGQVLEVYSQRLSILTRNILELAGEFANSRDRYRGELTSSCILFAAVEMGSPLNHDPEVDNASQFLFHWMHENESRSSQYKRAFSDFRRESIKDPRQWVATLTANSLKVIETAALIAKFVRKGAVPREHNMIYARDLVGALLFTMATNKEVGAARRATAWNLSLETLRKDYFDDYLDHEKNPDDIEHWRKVIIDLTLPVAKQTPKTPLELKPSLPNIDADTPSVKVDLLNITPEVEGFAKIIASADVKTPLSIGLFGDWGSGKSTFMEQLQATVEKIAKSVREKDENEETAFLGNIVQIKFNAWHYAEANLWASLVSHVFENLSFSEAEEKQKAENRKQLFLGKLANTLAIQREAEAEVKVKEANYEIAKTALEDVQRNQEFARLELRHVITEGVWPLVSKFLNENSEAQRQLDEARKVLGKAGLSEEELKREIEASRTTAGQLQLRLTSIASDPHRTLWLVVILALTILIPLVLTYAVAQFANGGSWERVITNATPILTLIGGALTWFQTKRKTVDSILDTLAAADRQLDQMYARAQDKFNSERDRLIKEVEDRQAAIVSAKKEVEDAKKERAETIAALREMEPGRVLETFVQERAASTDYRKLLGVVALIRRDFKRLSDMLREQGNVELRQAVTEILKKDEEQRKLEAQTADGDGNVVLTAVAEPPQELVEQKLKEYRIDRIVLYIDDLDRCPPKQVVDVLQAIHLLLAFELFVVVVGVDARWIRHALRDRYPKLLSEDWGNGAPKRGKERLPKFATPRDYIEKIFQVPFWLRPMDDSAAQRLLEGLIPVSQISSDAEPDQNVPADRSNADGAAAANNGGAVSAGGAQHSAGATTSPETPAVDRETQANEIVANAGARVEQFEFVLKPQSLLLDIDERNAMVALWRVIGKTPRTLKRFVNVYRIIKAGLNANEFEAFVGTGPSDAQYKAVLVLLAVAYGAPDVAPAFFRALKNGEKESGLKEFLTSMPPSNGAESLQSGWSSLLKELNTFVNEYDVNMSLAVLCEWLPVVVRYTFQHGSLSEEVANRQARAVQVMA